MNDDLDVRPAGKPPELWQIARQCRAGFENLQHAVCLDTPYVKDVLDHRTVDEEQDRYNQWARNLGALQPSSSKMSLDHRLRDAPIVAQMLLKTLMDLHTSLIAAGAIASGERDNRTMQPGQTTEEPSEDSDFDISDESDTSSVESDSGDKPATGKSEVVELVAAIRTSLNSLFTASMFIKKHSARDRRQRAAGTKPFDSRADTMYILDRFPAITSKRNETLAARLGEANARRRQYFKYRRDHVERLGNVKEDAYTQPQIQPEPVKDKAPLREATKSVFTAESKPSQGGQTLATDFLADPVIEQKFQETNKATHAPSIVSFATTILDLPGNELAFPYIPKEGRGGLPFICPYCQDELVLKGQNEMAERQWKKHVVRDLEPYVCTFQSCTIDTYHSQQSWLDHELLIHRSVWSCSYCSFSEFLSADLLREHITRHHSEKTIPSQLTALVERSKRSVDSILASECPFCDEPWATDESGAETDSALISVRPDEFRKHVGHHLLQIALFSLPRASPDMDGSLALVSGAGDLDRDVMSEAPPWGRFDCGVGWSAASKKRLTIMALSHFLKLYEEKESRGSHIIYQGADEFILRFRWLLPATEVFVTGTFDDWTKSTKLYLSIDGSGFQCDVAIDVPNSTRDTLPSPIIYKFVVDGEWTISPLDPKEQDENGNENNVLRIPRASHKSTASLQGMLPPEGLSAYSPPNRRPRAPTITIDSSAVSPQDVTDSVPLKPSQETSPADSPPRPRRRAPTITIDTSPVNASWPEDISPPGRTTRTKAEPPPDSSGDPGSSRGPPPTRLSFLFGEEDRDGGDTGRKAVFDEEDYTEQIT